MASEFETDTRDFADVAGLDDDMNVTLRNLQRYSSVEPVDFDGGFIDGESSDSVDLESEDRVTTTTISVEEFEIASTDYDVIDARDHHHHFGGGVRDRLHRLRCHRR